MGAIIWQKVTTSNTMGGVSVMGSYPYPRNGIIKIDYEFILLFKKYGKPPKPTKEQKLNSKLTPEEWNEFFSDHWNFPGERQNGHLAMFPLELPYRLIKMFSFVGKPVLDSFCGSGTTNLAAIKLSRNSVGYEINREFKGIIEEKLKAKEQNLFEKNYDVIFIEQKEKNINYDSRPCIFRDPVKFDKKVDARKLNFGSKITEKENLNERYFYVKDVITPDRILLNSGQLIKLIGIKPNNKKFYKAIDFIKNLTKGKLVYLKFDDIKYDNENNLLAYLYLKNKTFINAYLIKNKLVDVDTVFNYRYRKKFELLANL